MDAANNGRYVYSVFCYRMEDLCGSDGKVYVGAIEKKEYRISELTDDRLLAFKLIRAARKRGYNSFRVYTYDRQKQLGDGHFRPNYPRYIDVANKKVGHSNIGRHRYGV
jgi:hypothetical protein